MLTLDFETEAIQPRPDFPPRPVGVALLDGQGARYIDWGHPDSNRVRQATARANVRRAADSGRPILCHNAPFDLSVLYAWLGAPVRGGIHDTMVLAFLLDPYGDLSLKPLAKRYLHMPPDEADAVRQWLVDNGVVRKSMAKGWGAHISKAPADIVGRYAVGDVERTRALFDTLLPQIDATGMRDAYDREVALMPHMIEAEERGIPVDVDALRHDETRYTQDAADLEAFIRHDLAAPDLDINRRAVLFETLAHRYECATERTEKGNTRTARDALERLDIPGPVKAAIMYRDALEYQLSHFIRPWLAQAARDGRVHTHWNQVRGTDDTGARTGRLSSSPNLQNITTGEKLDGLLRKLRALHEREYLFPNVRGYIKAPPGWVLLGRDYNQQELRLLAHFEDDALQAAYQGDPRLDMHQYTVDLIRDRAGVDVTRKQAKVINFARIYGAGKAKIAEQLGLSLDAATDLLAAYATALPGVARLQRDCAARGRDGVGIRTLGGRVYKAPPPTVIKGEVRTFEYRLLNYLIQGSAADQTKEAMVAWHDATRRRRSGVQFLLSVHDELLVMCKASSVERESKALGKAMAGAFAKALDVPMLTDAEAGPNWGEMEPME